MDQVQLQQRRIYWLWGFGTLLGGIAVPVDKFIRQPSVSWSKRTLIQAGGWRGHAR